MTNQERQAHADGLVYTGISYPSWSTSKKERAEQRVAEIKKLYKVKFRKVKGEDEYVGYYASPEYNLIRWDAEQTIRNRIATVEERKRKAFEEYNKIIVEIMHQEELDKKQLEEIVKIKR